MLNFKPSKMTLALLSSGLIAASVSSFAAQAADTHKKKTEKEIEVIEVTGIRGSLQKAQAIKMSTSSIIEVISAEDIGKLPDTSIAESLARLPGVTGERRNGRTSGLSVRGFNENYIGTSLNGRELLGMGDNRGVEFDLYPTEIVSQIVVYKTPEAGLLNQGIGGTIDLQTVAPLTAKKALVLNANYEKNGTASRNPDFSNKGHRFSLNYVDQFADDTLGLALVLSSQETPRQEQQFRGWGYATVNQDNPRRATDTVAVPDGTLILGGQDSYTRSAMLKRNSVAAVVQYAPNDNLMVQFDALYIDFKESDVKRGIESGGAEWGTGDYTITGVDSGVVTSGFYDGFNDVIRNDGQTQDSTLKTYGLNLEYTINDDWTATVDLSTGDVNKNIIDIESYSGTGRGGAGAGYARSFTSGPNGAFYSDHPTIAPLDYTNSSLITLAGPQNWGGGMTGIPGPFFGTNDAQDGFVNQPSFKESLDSIRFDVNGVLDGDIFSGVTFGANYSDRVKTKVNNGFFLTAPTYPNDGAIPDPLGAVDVGFGLGSIIAYDGIGLYTNGFYNSTDGSLSDTDRKGDSYAISEKVFTAYAKLDIEAELGNVLVSGNLGVQVINVDQSASGSNTISGGNGLVVATAVTDGAIYTDILPTLNLSFEIAESQFIRTAISKVQSRPRMDQMKPNNVVNFDFNDSKVSSTDVQNSPWSGKKGNAKIRPLEANQFDLSYENYFADDGYFAVSFFFKDLTNWQKQANAVVDFSDVYIPGFHQSSDATGNQPPAQFTGGVSTTSDGLTGFVRGYEAQASIPLRYLHKSLEGFGVVASATFLNGALDVPKGDDGSIPGLSKESYSGTVYYEHEGFEVRVSATKRSKFSTQTRGLSLSLSDTVDEGATLVDAQISYDFSKAGIPSLEGLTVSLQGQNLTNENTIQSNGTFQVTKFQSFGSNYLLNVNYKF
ncbi:MAG: TonB-dependent receptor [Alteromonadaceae bacterium]|nr:TonB-dependent receptor [Alteromonadaceae bacterium]